MTVMTFSLSRACVHSACSEYIALPSACHDAYISLAVKTQHLSTQVKDKATSEDEANKKGFSTLALQDTQPFELDMCKEAID